MKLPSVKCLFYLSILLPGCSGIGCTGARSSAVTDQYFEVPGQYAARPMSTQKPRVGIPIPVVEVAGGIAPGSGLQELAANQLFWVADQTGRFNLIDHTRFAGLVAEQSGGAGPLASGELIHAAPLRGIDFILVCNISALSVRGDNKPDTVSVARVEKLLHLADPKPRITTRCVVNLRLIDPATGLFAARIEDSFQRVCSPEAMGLKFTDPDAAWGELRLDEQQTLQVLRTVIDDGMRKLLPDVDAMLARRDKTAVISTPSASSQPTTLDPTRDRSSIAPVGGKLRPSAVKIHCKECGFEATSDDQFCPSCGAAILPATTQPEPKKIVK